MVDLARVSKPKSLLTNMRILDRGHAQQIYDHLLNPHSHCDQCHIMMQNQRVV